MIDPIIFKQLLSLLKYHLTFNSAGQIKIWLGYKELTMMLELVAVQKC